MLACAFFLCREKDTEGTARAPTTKINKFFELHQNMSC